MPQVSSEEITRAVAGDTVPRAFLRTVAEHGELVALRARRGEGYEEWTYAAYAALVARAAAGLRHHGVGPGDTVMLMTRNRPEFHWFDSACQFLRATGVSIYNTSSPEEIAYLAGHAEAKVAIVEHGPFLDKFLKGRDELPALQRIFVIEPVEGAPADVSPADELLDHGALDLAELAAATEPDDLATLIYTSGTTGPPKGVMLTQSNIMFTLESLRHAFDLESYAGRRLISYLPMAHIAERTSSHYHSMLRGFTVTTCPDPTLLAEYARDVRPEVVFGVPRVWEKIHAGVQAALARDPEKREKFDEAVAVALEIKEAERAGTATDEQRETWAFLDAVAFSTVRQLVGLDALLLGITGAAPIAKEVLEWFVAIGVPLSEIYGLSETSGPMTWEPRSIKPGTVGPAIPGTEVRLGDDGEVLCRGGNIFQGYFKSPQQTAATLVDGWLHTGDIGTIDEDGYVTIVDRKKELIITSGGKNISPANLEAALKLIPLIGQACAVGDKRRYVTALLVLDPEVAPAWAEAHGLGGRSLAALAEEPAVLEEVQRGVDAANEHFAQVEQVKRFTLLGEEWLPASDVLTPTSKLKRRGVLARYADDIERMYATR